MRFSLPVACMLICGPVRASEPPSAPPTADFGGADGLFNGPARAATPAPSPAPPVVVGDAESIRFDVVFGLPTALRVQARLGGTKTWVEAGAAAYVIIPSVFVGLRRDGLLHRSDSDALLVRPGVDVYYVPVYGRDWLFGDYRHGVGVVAADFDMAWQHRWSDAVTGNVGIKLGCGVGIIHRGVFPVPIVGVTCGLQF